MCPQDASSREWQVRPPVYWSESGQVLRWSSVESCQHLSDCEFCSSVNYREAPFVPYESPRISNIEIGKNIRCRNQRYDLCRIWEESTCFRYEYRSFSENFSADILLSFIPWVACIACYWLCHSSDSHNLLLRWEWCYPKIVAAGPIPHMTSYNCLKVN